MKQFGQTSSSLARALKAARETRCLVIERGAATGVAEVIRTFGQGKPAMVVADTNTFAVAGRQVQQQLEQSGLKGAAPFIYDDPALYAEHRFVVVLDQALQKNEAIPLAVGSGTINDLTKLAAHRTGRPYIAIATAASMDGYTAFGASITYNGSKQTFSCPAPVAAIADLDIIAAAPAEMNAAGYADLLAKTTAGADWLLADALGVEPIEPEAWAIVQGNLREALADPEGVRTGQINAIERLTEGLMLGGFAMQSAQSSRPASGAEHQFSHLWDMQHHTHNGRTPSHGFKVGIGTLAIAALYEWILEQPLERLDLETCCNAWPSFQAAESDIRRLLQDQQLAAIALEESRAKYVDPGVLRSQLETIRECWPELRVRLRQQLLPVQQLKQMLEQAGAPTTPEQIGISRDRLRQSFEQAYYLRRRFTILDLAVRTNVLAQGLHHIFKESSQWSARDKHG